MRQSRNATPSWFAVRAALQTGLLAAAMTHVIGYAGAQLQDPGQRPGRRQAGQAGNNPLQTTFLAGKVTGRDPATGAIVINFSDTSSQTIKANQDTKFVMMSEIQISGLKIGDQVQIQGVPTKITANSISAGELPDVMTFGIGGRRNRGAAAGREAGDANVNAADPNAPAQAPKPPLQAIASASGKITSKEPLTIALSDEISVVLKVSDTTRVTKIVPATINSIKLGDFIVASGKTMPDGTFVATGVGINIGSPGGQPGGGPGGVNGGRPGRRGLGGQGANGGGANP